MLIEMISKSEMADYNREEERRKKLTFTFIELAAHIVVMIRGLISRAT